MTPNKQQQKLLVANVHGYFETKTHFSCTRCCPHKKSPFDKICNVTSVIILLVLQFINNGELVYGK